MSREGYPSLVTHNAVIFQDQSNSSPTVPGGFPMATPNTVVFQDQSNSFPRVPRSFPMATPNTVVFQDQSNSSPRVPGSFPMATPNTVVFQDQSNSSPRVQGSLPVVTPKEEMQNGTDHHAEMAVFLSKKLQDELQAMGLKVKQHEENLKFLKGEINKLDGTILDMHVALGKYHTETPDIENSDHSSHDRSAEKVVEHILSSEKSAAGVYHQLLAHHKAQASNLSVMKDVVGTVATLCSVDDDNLSWLLAEFLGRENMLALVCKTMDGVKILEMYDKDRLINTSGGIHGLGATIGRQFENRYLAICLEHLRPFTGHFIADDPQRRLDLRTPKLPNGEAPPGFIGFAVNIISLENAKLFRVTNSGHGLRETLFYHLLSSLQVYKTRAEMLKALPLISNGAVSLDGGIIKCRGVFSLGNREDVGVKFPKSFTRVILPEDYFRTENKMKETNWEKERVVDDMRREQELLDKTKRIFESKKQEFVKFLTESATFVSQNQNQFQTARTS